MLVSRADIGDAGRHATREELARALARLSASDLKRLELIGRLRSANVVGIEWQDLLQEALARAMAGGRRWPRDVPIVAFLAQVMRSLASELRTKYREDELEAGPTGADVTEDGLASLEAASQLRTIEKHFDQDPQVSALLDGIRRGETAGETQIRTGLDARTYDAARKRFWRGVADLNGDKP